jgi:hypothetical protein
MTTSDSAGENAGPGLGPDRSPCQGRDRGRSHSSVRLKTMSATVVRGLTLLALISSTGCAPQPPQSQQQAPTASTVPTSAIPSGMLPCNWSVNSGGEGETHHLHYLGDTPGLTKITYNNNVKPDDIKVVYRGQVIAGTGGPRSGRGALSFDWNPVAGDYAVDVVVTGSLWGTRWNYSMSCPVAMSS